MGSFDYCFSAALPDCCSASMSVNFNSSTGSLYSEDTCRVETLTRDEKGNEKENSYQLEICNGSIILMQRMMTKYSSKCVFW
jgi:hypothetical protein